MDEKGRICLEKAKLITYSHGEYYALGRRIGKFGFSAAKKKNTQQKKQTKDKSK
jgi:hypothetical protein